VTVTRWAVVIIRLDDTIDPLSQLHDDEQAARKYARRCCSWYQCVQAVRILPVTIDASIGMDIPIGLPLHEAMEDLTGGDL
jgi:hypothetical protein